MYDKMVLVPRLFSRLHLDDTFAHPIIKQAAKVATKSLLALTLRALPEYSISIETKAISVT